MSSIVAIAHVPIITAPYGLLKLFKPSHQGYAAAIPLFVPTLGINYVILYGMNSIATGDGTIYDKTDEITHLSGIIAFFSILSTISTLFFLFKLQTSIT